MTGVCPAFFPTNIINSGRFNTPAQHKMANQLMSQSRATADDVARRVMRVITRRQLYVFVPAVASVFWRLKRLMPRTVLNLIASRQKREKNLAAKQ